MKTILTTQIYLFMTKCFLKTAEVVGTLAQEPNSFFVLPVFAKVEY